MSPLPPPVQFQPGQFHPGLPPVPPKGRRRWGVVVAGIVVGVLALAALVGGGVVEYSAAVESDIDPTAEGRTPGAVTFEAEAERYTVSVVNGRRRASGTGLAGQTECEIVRSDGTRIGIDGSFQGVGSENGRVESVGRFDAVPGPTTVTCVSGDDEVRFIVDQVSDLERAGRILMFSGLGVGVLAAATILVGVFTRRRPSSA
jgi:hypothetical protein